MLSSITTIMNLNISSLMEKEMLVTHLFLYTVKLSETMGP